VRFDRDARIESLGLASECSFDTVEFDGAFGDEAFDVVIDRVAVKKASSRGMIN